MKEDLERIQGQITVLTAIQFDAANADIRQQILDSMQDVREEYEKAAEIRDAKDTSEKDRKYYTGICDSISKGLPNITKGALAAASAFQKGDTINGAAAIMDICAAAAPILASLFVAGGPAGALVGALFSVVGQLLAFFGPKQPSLKDQIQKMLEKLNAEDELKNLEGIRLNIEDYDKLLTAAAIRLTQKDPITGKRLLERDLLTESDADRFEIDVKALNYSIALSQAKSIASSFENWKVAGWLKMPAKQSYDQWPEVLGTWCRAYMDFVTANMKFIGMVDLPKVRAVMAYHHEQNSQSPLPDGRRKTIRGLMRDLAALTEVQRDSVKASNAVALNVIKDITPAAQARGLFLHVGGGYLYALTGKASIQHGDWTYLKGGSDAAGSGVGYIYRICASFPAGSSGVALPRFPCFVQREGRTTFVRELTPRSPPEINTDHRINHWFNNSEWKTGVSDLWAIPQNKNVTAFLAVDNSIFALALTGEDKVENWGWRVDGCKAPVAKVRAVTPESLANDPDKAAISPGSDVAAVYGGLAANSDIWMNYNNVTGYVPTPWTQYTGLSVDRHFLWVFGTGGFACATHASVIKALNDRAKGVQTVPAWIEHYPNGLLYKGIATGAGLVPLKNGEPALQGLSDLSACDDGTLFVNAYARKYNDQGGYSGDDGPLMGTATYSVDVPAKTIQVAEWTMFGGGGRASQVEKLPIYCWSMLESTKANLSV